MDLKRTLELLKLIKKYGLSYYRSYPQSEQLDKKFEITKDEEVFILKSESLIETVYWPDNDITKYKISKKGKFLLLESKPSSIQALIQIDQEMQRERNKCKKLILENKEKLKKLKEDFKENDKFLKDYRLNIRELRDDVVELFKRITKKAFQKIFDDAYMNKYDIHKIEEEQKILKKKVMHYNDMIFEKMNVLRKYLSKEKMKEIFYI